jgi:hypothetical protein
MPLSFEDELTAFMRHNFEQIDVVQQALVQGKHGGSLEDAFLAVSTMIGVHNQALILVAQEIDKLRAATTD